MKETLEDEKALHQEIINKLQHMNSNTNKQLIAKVEERLERIEKLLNSIS